MSGPVKGTGEAGRDDREPDEGLDDPWGAAIADDAAHATAGLGDPEPGDPGLGDPGLGDPGLGGDLDEAAGARNEAAGGRDDAATGRVLAPGQDPAGPKDESGFRPKDESGFPDAWPGREAIHEPPRAGRPAIRTEPQPAPAQRSQVQRPQPRPRPAQPPGGDLLTGAQRWLIRSSARTMRREIEDSVRRSIGSGRRPEPGDIWGAATTEPPPQAGESPECAWCPICRAARRMREPGSGLAGVSDAVAAAVQDAFGALDGVLSRATGATGHERPAEPGSRHADSAGDHDHPEKATDEPGDRG